MICDVGEATEGLEIEAEPHGTVPSRELRILL